MHAELVGDVSDQASPTEHTSEPARLLMNLPRLPQPMVERHRLHRVLETTTPLVVVHAPVGFGKTTLVASWAARSDGRRGAVIWLNAYRAGDPETFWSGAIDAFEAGGIVLPEAGTAFARLTAGLSRRHAPVVLVIDDFDATADPGLENDLLALTKRHRALRVIVCMRGSHSFSDRADIDTTTITARDLAFTAEETRALLRASGSRSDEAFAALVRESTLGWPEPTRALAVGLSGHADTEDLATTAARVARDYLHRRMLPQFDGADWLDFAFTTAVPEQLTADQAEYLHPGTGAAARLARLEAEGLLHGENDDDERRYRWPAAARSALLDEFARHDPVRLAGLRGRLARWQLDRGEPVPALLNAADAENWPLVIEILEAHWGPVFRTLTSDLDEIFARIPRDILQESPTAVALRDQRLHRTGRPDDLLFSLPPPLPTETDELIRIGRSSGARRALGIAQTMMNALKVRGRMRAAAGFARAAEVIAESGTAHRAGEIAPLLASALLQVGITRLLAHDGDGALEALQRSFKTARARQDAPGHVETDAAGKIALLYALESNPAKAELWLTQAEDSERPRGWLAPRIALSGQMARALTAIERLDRSAAEAALDTFEPLLHTEQSWSLIALYIRACHAVQWGGREDALDALMRNRERYRAWAGDDTLAWALLNVAEVELLTSLGRGNEARLRLEAMPEHPALAPARAHLALLTGQDQRALRLAGDALGEPNRGPRMRLQLTAALAQARLGLTEPARDSLRSAAESARASGAVRPFALVPADELAELAAQVPEASALLETEPLRSRPAVFPDRLATIELTERERTILSLIEDGLNMRQMATTLYVSYNTVKTHMRGLYQKVGASSREQALANAYQLGLLRDASTS